MGNLVGLFTDNELENLSPEEHKKLKEEVIKQLQTSTEIRDRLIEDPRVLTRDEKIATILRRELAPRLK